MSDSDGSKNSKASGASRKSGASNASGASPKSGASNASGNSGRKSVASNASGKSGAGSGSGEGSGSEDETTSRQRKSVAPAGDDDEEEGGDGGEEAEEEEGEEEEEEESGGRRKSTARKSSAGQANYDEEEDEDIVEEVKEDVKEYIVGKDEKDKKIKEDAKPKEPVDPKAITKYLLAMTIRGVDYDLLAAGPMMMAKVEDAIRSVVVLRTRLKEEAVNVELSAGSVKAAITITAKASQGEKVEDRVQVKTLASAITRRISSIIGIGAVKDPLYSGPILVTDPIVTQETSGKRMSIADCLKAVSKLQLSQAKDEWFMDKHARKRDGEIRARSQKSKERFTQEKTFTTQKDFGFKKAAWDKPTHVPQPKAERAPSSPRNRRGSPGRRYASSPRALVTVPSKPREWKTRPPPLPPEEAESVRECLQTAQARVGGTNVNKLVEGKELTDLEVLRLLRDDLRVQVWHVSDQQIAALCAQLDGGNAGKVRGSALKAFLLGEMKGKTGPEFAVALKEVNERSEAKKKQVEEQKKKAAAGGNEEDDDERKEVEERPDSKFPKATLVDEYLISKVRSAVTRAARADPTMIQTEMLLAEVDPEGEAEFSRDQADTWLRGTIGLDLTPKELAKALDLCDADRKNPIVSQDFMAAFGQDAQEVIDQRLLRRKQLARTRELEEGRKERLEAGVFKTGEATGEWHTAYKKQLAERDRLFLKREQEEQRMLNRMARKTTKLGSVEEVEWVSNRLFDAAGRQVKRRQRYIKKAQADQPDDYGRPPAEMIIREQSNKENRSWSRRMLKPASQPNLWHFEQTQPAWSSEAPNRPMQAWSNAPPAGTPTPASRGEIRETPLPRGDIREDWTPRTPKATPRQAETTVDLRSLKGSPLNGPTRDHKNQVGWSRRLRSSASTPSIAHSRPLAAWSESGSR